MTDWRTTIETMPYADLIALREGYAADALRVPLTPRPKPRWHLFSLERRIHWSYVVHFWRLKWFRLRFGPAARMFADGILDGENIVQFEASTGRYYLDPKSLSTAFNKEQEKAS